MANSTRRRFVQPLALAVAYYLAADVGFAFQSPTAPQSVLWLPNSILLATFLLAPISEWPAYFAAAFPAHMLVAWQSGSPVVTMALLFLTNCSDAALGAFLVRRFTRQPFQFRDLHSTAIFVLFGATLSPILLSFADAGISVATSWAPSYWAAFSTRVHSNVLTHLMVVPALVTTLTVDVSKLTRAQVLEALTFTLALLMTCVFAFTDHPAESEMTALVLPLPLLFWAAVRFGPGGVGWSLLLVAFVASWDALHGRGPFTTGLPMRDVKTLQLFLLSIAAPLLFLSTTIEERRLMLLRLRENLARVDDLTAKLMSAQRLERMRIARDLHDDVGQRVAALSIGLSTFLRNEAAVPHIAGVSAIVALQKQAAGLVESIRQLSHSLHVGPIDRTGLATLLREHCAELGRQLQITVAFAAHGNVDGAPHDVAVALDRIVQEALRNIAQHAGTSEASVTITRTASSVQVLIADQGRGFDAEVARRMRGMGLLSIEERAKAIGGTMTIDTMAGSGTKILVDAPISTDEAMTDKHSRVPRVVLADDHKIVLDGLRYLLKDSCDVVAAVGDGPSLVAAASELHPDVIVADISMPGFGGLEAVKRLKASDISSKVIVLTMHMDREIVSAVAASGAEGYMPKHVAGEELIAAIRQVYDGFTYFKPTMGGHYPGSAP